MAFSESQEQIEYVEQYHEFLDRYYRAAIGHLVRRYPTEQRSLTIEWSDLFQFDPELADEYRENPQEQGKLLDESLTAIDLPVDIDLSGASVRVNAPTNGSMTFTVGETQAKHCGEFLALCGQISKTSKVRPKLIEGAFECHRCSTITTVTGIDHEVRLPNECRGCERQGPFRLVEGQSEFVDHQSFRLRQPPASIQGGHGRYIDVHVEGEDIVDEVQAGDRVTLSGQLEIDTFEEDGDAIVDTFFSGQAARIEQTDYEDIDIAAHTDRIEALANGEEGDPYERLIDSFAPKIHGRSSIKLAIILQLFGGTRVEYPTGEVDRGDSHVLLLGDPGTAKSQLLQTVEELAPRSSYASGKGATAAGLTAAAVSDDFGDSQWSLEAGAIALAHKGVACVDEIDKINENAVSSLHDALESQRIVVNKAGINTTLPAQTAVLAAGNPKYGRFDEYETLAEQIDISPALLSRFDLLFLLQDTPDEDRDETVADHIVEYRQHGIATQETDTDAFDVPVCETVVRAWIAHANDRFDLTSRTMPSKIGSSKRSHSFAKRTMAMDRSQ